MIDSAITDIPDTIDGLVQGVRQGIVQVLRVGHTSSSQLLMWVVMQGLEVAGMLLFSKAVVMLLVIVLDTPVLSNTATLLIVISDFVVIIMHFVLKEF